VLTPKPLPDSGQIAPPGDLPLNALQKDLVGLANAIGGDPKRPLSDIITVFDAIEVMKRTIGARPFCR
jgi:hypothetical protein